MDGDLVLVESAGDDELDVVLVDSPASKTSEREVIVISDSESSPQSASASPVKK